MEKRTTRENILLSLLVLLSIVSGYLFYQMQKQLDKIDAFIPEAEKLMEENVLLRQSLREQYTLIQQYENLLETDKAGQFKPVIDSMIAVDSFFSTPADLNFKDLNRP